MLKPVDMTKLIELNLTGNADQPTGKNKGS
jgi:hypothetical protein